ncbi:glycosyltransferase [Prochlorococcus marinus]|uniref:Glycosyltransferase 2-like domain-containing protein n=1 Tax=Prochlorococcus marinus (strain AS9601) TaxID=146891 RepID=A2BSC6_PROMS|nr:glycosyltransferase [Prochlorococcus marinus]ABM70687.1 Hypothetical protein A9601_14031 [Prochlorococcus marinus str. AS9601]
MNYKFLIVVPTFNSYKILSKLIYSLEKQTYPFWRVLFVDGFSTKEHINFLKKICKENNHFSWSYQLKTKPGIYSAMNYGATKAKKDEWTLFWGSDDWASSSNVFESLNKYINKCIFDKKFPDLLISNCTYVDRNENPSRKGRFLKKKDNVINHFNSKEFRKALFKGYIPSHQATIFSKKSLCFEPLYDSQYELTADLDFFLRFSNKSDLNVTYIDYEAVYLAKGGISGRKPLKRINEVFKSYKLNYPFLYLLPIFTRYFRKILSSIIK